MRNLFLAMVVSVCVGGGFARGQLTTNDVRQIIAQAVHQATNVSPESIIAVTDREGFVLAVWEVTPSTANATNTGLAVAKAGTAAFLSSGQHAFSTRTAGFIIMQHFPPLLPLHFDLEPYAPLFDPLYCPFPDCIPFPIPRGYNNRPPGPLVGVQYSSLPHSDINFFKAVDGTPVLNPGSFFALDGTPGGVPLYKNGILVGGIGVTGDANPSGLPDFLDFNFKSKDVDEEVALAGQFGYAPPKTIFGSRVALDGIRPPYIRSRVPKLDTNVVFFSTNTAGNAVAPFAITDPPVVMYDTAVLGGVTGEVRSCFTSNAIPTNCFIRADPFPDTINGAARLSASEVTNILSLAAQRSQFTRARIRLPRNQPAQVFISVVNNPGTNGGPALLLGTFRTPDATIFSWDVSVQKARTSVFFSDTNNTFAFFGSNNFNIAYSSRAVGFLSQSLYPPGLGNTKPGPIHLFQESVSCTTCINPPNANLPNGITIFPGGFPLYRDGQLIGAIGISGDGVDEDEIIGAAGTVSNLPPHAIRSDQFSFRGARLPYAKFPRDPDLDR